MLYALSAKDELAVGAIKIDRWQLCFELLKRIVLAVDALVINSEDGNYTIVQTGVRYFAEVKLDALRSRRNQKGSTLDAMLHFGLKMNGAI